MTIKTIKTHFEKTVKRFYIVELMVILILSSLLQSNFEGFSNIVWFSKTDRIGEKKSFEILRKEHGGGERLDISFLRKNLVIDWDYYGYLSTSGKKKAFDNPIFLSPNERKPYYLFNVDVRYEIYPLRFFRNFTKGDNTIKFAENNKEIKALVFYKKDYDKVMEIERKVKRIEWEIELENFQNIGLNLAQIDELDNLIDSYLSEDHENVISMKEILQIQFQLKKLKNRLGETLGIIFFED